jgi:hypothetical protein
MDYSSVDLYNIPRLIHLSQSILPNLTFLLLVILTDINYSNYYNTL